MGGGGGSLPVLGEASASVEPGDGALDDPAARQDHEAMRIGTLDDLDGEAVEMRDGVLQRLPGIAAISEEADERGKCIPAALDEGRCAITVPGLRRGRLRMSAE